MSRSLWRNTSSRIASERPTLLAHDVALGAWKMEHVVASLPRDRRCWHSYEDWYGRFDGESHRFRETDAVGTQVRQPERKHHHGRIASERPTLLARMLNELRELYLKVASLPRDRRCWHQSPPCRKACHLHRRIASERPTLLALELAPGNSAKSLSHRFRETDAVGTRPTRALSSAPSSRRRIASERPTLLAHVAHTSMVSVMRSHRFRETDAVGT